jgi:type II secretory pathway component PulJ
MEAFVLAMLNITVWLWLSAISSELKRIADSIEKRERERRVMMKIEHDTGVAGDRRRERDSKWQKQ